MTLKSGHRRLAGSATPEATRAYAAIHAAHAGAGHYSDFLRTRIRLSSIGVGTFPGAASPAADAQVAGAVTRALQSGINVVDTAAHYRYGRALAAVGAGVRAAVEAGVPRAAMFLVSKGGFLSWRGGRPDDPELWFEREIVAQGLGTRDDLAGMSHLISPAYINYQLELSRTLMGIDTLDAFLVDQPEVHIAGIGKEALNRKLLQVFILLERAVRDGRLRCYGISTFDGFRVETDHLLFQSLASLLGLAEKAVQAVEGRAQARHHLKLVSMPYNQVMLEGFSRFNQATGQGNVASTVQAAHQLKLYLLASHTLLKGHLAKRSAETLEAALPALSPVQRALQFNRSTPGIGTTLVGISDPDQVTDLIQVMNMDPLPRQTLMAMFKRTE